MFTGKATEDRTPYDDFNETGSRPAEEHHEKRRVCPVYFGVKSYLGEFYDPSHNYKDPSIYEEDDFRYLLNPKAKRRRRCAPIWLKICIWVGVNLLLFGIIGIIVGYFVPQKEVINKIEATGDNVAYIDHDALKYNTGLDLCKLLGVIFFSVGGILLSSALLFPSFLASQCEDDHNEETIRVMLGEENEPPRSPIQKTVPTDSKLKNIQPEQDKTQAMRPPSVSE